MPGLLWTGRSTGWFPLRCPACLAAYFGAVVDRARARYGQAAVLDDACAVADLARALDARRGCPAVLAEFHLRNDKRCRANLDAVDPAGAPRAREPVAPDAPGLPAATLAELRRTRPARTAPGCAALLERAERACNGTARG